MVAPAATRTPAPVGLLVTCLAEVMRPAIVQACRDLLRQVGVEPLAPATQTCCGQPALNAGRRDDARSLARKLARDFAAHATVIAPSGSCIGAVVTHLPKLFSPDEPGHVEVKELAGKCRELSQFLDEQGFKPRPAPAPCRVAFHDSCAGLRELGIGAVPRALLAAAGHELVPLAGHDTCCGFGGTFAVKFGAVSGEMADNKCAAAEASGADVLVMGDLGCILNVEGRMRRRGAAMPVRHWAELLVPAA